MPRANASAFPSESPTRSAPMSPGPAVAATRSSSETSAPASPSACSKVTGRFSRCARAAISGTTPPYGACAASCDETTFDSTRPSPSSTATDVSSQEVSIPRTSMASPSGQDGEPLLSRRFGEPVVQADEGKGLGALVAKDESGGELKSVGRAERVNLQETDRALSHCVQGSNFLPRICQGLESLPGDPGF